MCFCASSAFVPFSETKRGKNRYQLVGTCVCACVRAFVCVLCGFMSIYVDQGDVRWYGNQKSNAHRQLVIYTVKPLFTTLNLWLYTLLYINNG